jgi:hypothetical protein
VGEISFEKCLFEGDTPTLSATGDRDRGFHSNSGMESVAVQDLVPIPRQRTPRPCLNQERSVAHRYHTLAPNLGFDYQQEIRDFQVSQTRSRTLTQITNHSKEQVCNRCEPDALRS